jgi:hypothetical protein
VPFFLPLFVPLFSVHSWCFPFDANSSVRHACCMKHSADKGAPIDQLKGEIKGSFIKVGPLKRPAHRAKENEARATEVADLYWRMRFEEGLTGKEAVARIRERYAIRRSYVHKMLKEVAERRDY